MSVPLRILFSDEDLAYQEFHGFAPLDLEIVSGYSRKRDGASHALLLHLHDPLNLPSFLAACRQSPGVVDVVTISEQEFWKAPSNSI
jgi:hypothetical protein